MPKVSICIPTYKQVEFLRRTLNSVLEQDFLDYELIISDDSVDDKVENLIREFDFKGKLNYFRNNPALGSPANWNFAMKQAKGEYIKILHHDDFFTSKQSLSKFVKSLDANPLSSFAFSGTLVDLLAMKTTKIHACSNKQFAKMIAHPDQLFFSNYIGAPSATIFRKNKLLPFDVNLKWLVDVDWYIQMIENNRNVINIKEALICTIHGAEGQITQSVISDKEIQIKEHVYLFNKLGDKIAELKKYSVFFQLLFHKYKIENSTELRAIISVPEKSEAFFSEAIRLKDRNVFFKKVNYWLNKKSLKDHLFTLKTFFK